MFGINPEDRRLSPAEIERNRQGTHFAIQKHLINKVTSLSTTSASLEKSAGDIDTKLLKSAMSHVINELDSVKTRLTELEACGRCTPEPSISSSSASRSPHRLSPIDPSKKQTLTPGSIQFVNCSIGAHDSRVIKHYKVDEQSVRLSQKLAPKKTKAKKAIVNNEVHVASSSSSPQLLHQKSAEPAAVAAMSIQSLLSNPIPQQHQKRKQQYHHKTSDFNGASHERSSCRLYSFTFAPIESVDSLLKNYGSNHKACRGCQCLVCDKRLSGPCAFWAPERGGHCNIRKEHLKMFEGLVPSEIYYMKLFEKSGKEPWWPEHSRILLDTWMSNKAVKKVESIIFYLAHYTGAPLPNYVTESAVSFFVSFENVIDVAKVRPEVLSWESVMDWVIRGLFYYADYETKILKLLDLRHIGSKEHIAEVNKSLDILNKRIVEASSFYSKFNETTGEINFVRPRIDFWISVF